MSRRNGEIFLLLVAEINDWVWSDLALRPRVDHIENSTARRSEATDMPLRG